MRTLTNKLNERLNGLNKEDYQLLLYCTLLAIFLQLDSIHCKLFANYYKIENLISYDRNGLLLILSIIFGIIDCFLSYKIYKLVYNLPAVNVDIEITNHFISSIKVKGLKKLLQFPAFFMMIVSSISILYDIYCIISKFIF